MIPDDFVEVKFSELGKIITGKTPKTKILKYWDGDIPFITPKDIQVNKFVNHTERCISDDGLQTVSGQLLPKNSICVSCIGNIGYVGLTLKDSITNQQINSIVPNSKFSSDYVFYLMKSYWPIFKSLENQSTTVSILNKSQFASLTIKVTENKQKQDAITEILSSLDDKIEVNNKINSNLEELAQTLYKRWFVDFEFPNEEGKPYTSSGGEMVESELGLIPKGWEVKSLSDNQYCSLIKPGIEPFDDEKTYIATADVSNTKITNLETKITMNDRPSRANMQPQSNSIWFAKMKDSRKLMRFSETSPRIEDLILSTGFAGVFCTEALDYFWTYLQTAEFDVAKNNLANGTTMEAINNSGISLIKLVIPDSQTLLAFNQILNPMYEMIEKNEVQNLNLANTRDLLLPKLMSGEIEV